MISAQTRGPKKGDIAPIPFSFETNQLELLNSVLATYINGPSSFVILSNGTLLYTYEVHDKAIFTITITNKLDDLISDAKKEYIKNNNLSKNTIVATLILSSFHCGIYVGKYLHDINELPTTLDKMILEFNEQNKFIPWNIFN